MLKVKINNEWVENVTHILRLISPDKYNEFTVHYWKGDKMWVINGKIQDIKWVEERQEEIERTPVSNDYREQMRGDMYDIKTLGAKLDEVIEAVNKLLKENKQ